MEDAAGFKDFTVATAFERFVASVETCVATWAAKPGGEGPHRLQAQLQHRFPWRSDPYILALHLPPAADPLGQHERVQQQPGQPQQQQQRQGQQPGAAPAWPLASSAVMRDAPDRLQQWFGVHAFLLLTPDSYSGRVLEEEEVHTLLSAAAVALAHARITWPLLVPVHDAVRDGYRGVAIAAASAGGATLHFDTDSLHTSRLRPGLLNLTQQLLLFARQLGAAGAPAAAAACRAAAGAELELPASMAADAAAGGTSRPFSVGDGSCHVALAVRHSYAPAEPGEDEEGSGGGRWAEDERRAGEGGSGDWDEQAPWRPWAAQADPVGCLELDIVWRFPSAAAALHAHTPEPSPNRAPDAEAGPWGLAPTDAADWRLLALSTSYERDTGHRGGFVLRAVDKPRRFLRLQSLAGGAAQHILAGSAEVAPELLPSDSSFSGMLLKLADSAKYAALAPDLGSLASADWWLQQGSYQPLLAPDWVLQEATRDVLHVSGRQQMAVLPVWPAFPPGSVAWPTSAAGQHGCLGKAAPLGALISRFALHAMALGSPRSVAELWSRFVSALRLQYWEALQPLPRMHLDEEEGQRQGNDLQQQQQADGGVGAAGSASTSSTRPEPPNLELSLLHQKLQMLDLCMHLLQEQRAQQGQQARHVPPPQPNGSYPAGPPQAGAKPAGAPDGWGWDSGDEDQELLEGGRQQRQQQQQAQRQQDMQRQPSLSSSNSSYFSAGGGSEANSLSTLSPARSVDQLQAQQAAEPAGVDRVGSGPDAAAPAAAVAPAPASAAASNIADGAAGGVNAAASGPALLAGDAGEGAVGVLPGVSLHLHPDRPLRVPAVQDPPPQTEDLLAEQQVALQAHPASPGQDASALRAQLQGRMLLSDMQAFKAANPGCCLLDFVRWHSPKDCIPAVGGSWKLSKRMAADGNAWQQLWASAAPLPAARQRPLLDPQLEGERALHFLETLPPAALYAELLAVGYSAAVQLLRTSGPAAELPAVQRQLGCLEAAARLELLHGVAAREAPAGASEQQVNGSSGAAPAAAAAEPAATAKGDEVAVADDAAGWEEEWEADQEEEQRAAEPPPRQLPQPAWLQSVYGSGLSSWRYHRLLLLLGCAEQTVVAAHSLILRLGWRPGQQRASSSGGSGGSSGEFAAASADKLIATALGEQEPPFQEPQLAAAEPAVAPASAVDLPAAHRQAAEALVALKRDDEPADDSGSDSAAGAASKWPVPFQQEWLMQVHAGHAPSNGSQPGYGAPGSANSALPVLQRMYVKALPAGVRIATVLGAEPCSLSQACSK